MAQAHKRFKLAAEAEAHLRAESLTDLKFRSGDQWPADIKVQRSKDGRPCLEMNRLEQFVRMVCNEERQQRPAIQVNPVGDNADVETAEIEQGLIRHIEVQSHADIARDHAFEMMVTIGWGYYRLVVEEDEKTGDLEIYQRKIKNPFSVYFDPHCQSPVYEDARWCFIFEDMPIAQYDDLYPDSPRVSMENWKSIGDYAPGWVTKSTVRVAEYFYVEGKGKDRTVKWAKINAVESLEGGPADEVDWQGRWIPILPVLGIDLDINGKRYLAGLVRNLRDPQRQYNYMNSAITEAIATAPRSQWLVAEGQIENYETQWKLQNQRLFAVLTYKQMDIGGKPAPPPQRIVAEPPIQAMVEALKIASDDMQAAAGIYNPSLGAPSADHSGKAILARQKQSDVTNLNWTDNLARTIWFEGEQLLDLIPKVYTEPRVRRIVNPDGTTKSVGVTNSQSGPTAEEAAELLDVPKIYDVGVGAYDITISVGPSYQSKRQEAVVSTMALMQTLPQQAPLIAPIAVDNMDIPGNKEIAKTLRKALPPQFQENDGSPDAQIQQLQAQNAQMQQMLQQQGMVLQQQHDIVQGKVLEQQTKKDIEVARIQADLSGKKLQYETQLAVAQINASKDRNEGIADRELQTLGMAHDAAHEVAMAHVGHQQALEQGAQQHQQTLEQGEQQGQQQSDLAQQAQQNSQAEENSGT